MTDIYQEIQSLWHGRLGEYDGALQILLIIDFIFDWACDIYRPTIISQLRALVNPERVMAQNIGIHRVP
jgi:hypothetical protein